MAVVNDFNADYPLEFYNFFKDIDCHYIQYALIVERLVSHQDGRHLVSLAEKEEGTLAGFSITLQQWGNFLCTLLSAAIHFTMKSVCRVLQQKMS